MSTRPSHHLLLDRGPGRRRRASSQFPISHRFAISTPRIPDKSQITAGVQYVQLVPIISSKNAVTALFCRSPRATYAIAQNGGRRVTTADRKNRKARFYFMSVRTSTRCSSRRSPPRLFLPDGGSCCRLQLVRVVIEENDRSLVSVQGESNDTKSL